MAHIRRPSAGSYPAALSSGSLVRYEADALQQVDGSAVNLLPDATGGGVNLAPGGGGTAPTFRFDDDLLPYIAFDGVTNILQNLAMPGGVGLLPQTIYSVLRVDTPVGTANAKAITLLRAGTVAGVAAGTWALRPDNAKRHMVSAVGGIVAAPVAEPNDAVSSMGGLWIVACNRWGNRGNPVMWWGHYFQNMDAYGVRFGGGFTPWNYDRIGVGGLADTAPFAADFCKMDFRHLSFFPVCHNDDTVKQNMRFLAHKWKVAVLD